MIIKRFAGAATALIVPKCKFDRAIFILGHMRCGSTALSHILCSHPEISGYGEAHIRYDGNAALGQLLINQFRRGAYRIEARHLFDKILHSRYDAAAGPGFFNARAIFMVREPVDTIYSIRRLFSTLGSSEYSTDAVAADYYVERVNSLLAIWEQFPSKRRIGLSYAQLTTEPEIKISSVSLMLDLIPPLTNHYTPPRNKLGHGAGDPLASHKYDKIVPATQPTASRKDCTPLELPERQLAILADLYARALQTVTRV